MEDLGTISINIREMHGGIDAAGSQAGGIAGGTAATNARDATMVRPLLKIQENTKNLLATAKTAPIASGGPAGMTAAIKNSFSGLQERLTRLSSLRSELTEFITRPSIGAVSRLTAEGTTTSAMLQSLGKSGAVLGKALLAIGIVGSVAAVALKGLQMASEFTAERISEVGRYSGEVMLAQAEQQVAKLRNAMREAAENGRAYAASVRAQTTAQNAKAFSDRELGYQTAKLAMAWEGLKTLAYTYAGMKAAEYNAPQRAVESLIYWMMGQGTIDPFSGLTGTPLQEKTLDELKKIEGNTRPATQIDQNDINAWFQADIIAMTGARY